MPGFDGLHNLCRDLERRVDFPVDWFRGGALANLQDLPVGGGQHHGDHLVGAQLLAQGPPRGVHTAIQESLLNRHQQMISQDAEEDMSLRAFFEMDADGPNCGRELRH